MSSSTRPCDPGPLDDLACQAKGVEAQATYNKEQEKELTEARIAFGNARSAYDAARHQADKALAPGREQLAAIFANRCSIDRSQAQRLDRAFSKVRRRLEECRPGPCCTDCECEWDEEVHRCNEPDDVAALIARIKWQIGRATRCFASLLDETKPAPDSSGSVSSSPAASSSDATATPAAAEPAAPPTTSSTGLAARVARVLAEIDAIEEHAEKGTWSPTRVYAAALVARWHLQNIWNGFADVNAYVDCLCQALTCMIKGHAAIAVLRRKAAVAECHREKWEEACAALDAQAVDEVLAEYLRICASDDDEDSDTGGYEPGGGGDDGGYERGGDGGYEGGDGPQSRGHRRPPEQPPASDGYETSERPQHPGRPRPHDGDYAGEPDESGYEPEPQPPHGHGAAPSDGPGPEGEGASDESAGTESRARGPRRRPPYRDARGRYRAP